ncbi:MAG: hypothetical protein U0470_03950 [Anaerolineae bacterium]
MPSVSGGGGERDVRWGAFKWADWSTKADGRIDLAVVDQYGVYVGHQGTGKAGVARVGPIVLLR